MSRILTDVEEWNLLESIEEAISELSELERSEDWFCSDALDRLKTAREILKGEDETD